MRTRRDDRKNTTRSAATRGRGRGPLTVHFSRGARGLMSPSRGSPERRGAAGLVHSPGGRSRGRPPGRPRGWGRGRARLADPPSDEDDQDDPSEVGDEEGLEEEEDEGTHPVVKEEVDETALDEEQQEQEAISPRRRLATGSAADSGTEPDESGDDALIDVLTSADSGRGSRKRKLPARFLDAPLQPLVRRRTVSSGSARGDRPPGSPGKQASQERSPVKQDRSLARSPPTISELLQEETGEDRPESPGRELVIESLETLTDAIELDHGMNCAPPPPGGSPPQRRQRTQSRSGDPPGAVQATLASGPLFQERLEHQSQPGAGLEIDEDDLITMELDPLEVPLPVQTVPRRPCKICHRHFKVTNLKQHMLTHTGMRPFKCEICSAAFTRRSDVFRHVKIVHQQEKPFKCARDGKEFSDRKALKAHMERHKRPSLFACKVCDFRFGKFEYYVNHLKFIHPTGEPIPEFPEDVEPEPEPVAPPRGRYGPTPLQAFMDEDDDDSAGGGGSVGGSLDHGIGEELQLAGGLESIETEEIPPESLQLVAGGADGRPAATLLPDSAVPDVVEGQDVVISTAEQPHQPERSADRPEEPQEQINFPPLEEDAAAILGMTDLALTNENTSLQSAAAAPLEEPPPPPVLVEQEQAPVSAPVVVLSGASLPVRHLREPMIAARMLTQSQPRVVTIGKPVTPAAGAGSSPKTVLLTRPRMVAGKQVLQAVKLGTGQKIVSARPAAGRGGGRQPIVRQVVINRPIGGGPAPRPAPRLVTTRVVRPATRIQPVGGPRTLGQAVAGAHLKTVSPAVRVVRPAAPPPPEPEPPQPAPVAVVPAAQPGGDTKNIEVTTSTAAGSRTIILQTSGGGGGGDILQSEEAMQTLLEAVQQLVSASGDTLEGKQIEIVMQNDGQPAGTETAGTAAVSQ